MQLDTHHIDAFARAEPLMQADYRSYLELKELLPDANPEARARFRALFAHYYNLNTGGLTPEFKDRFFEILFAGNVIVNGRPNYAPILTELSQIKRRKGDYAMPFSFVSKLVAIHQESSPIYDRHVVGFFGETVPAASVDKAKRIEWFVGFLDRVGTDYQVWAADDRMQPILGRLRARDPRLDRCHVVRLVDFLVWRVGNQKLLSA